MTTARSGEPCEQPASRCGIAMGGNANGQLGFGGILRSSKLVPLSQSVGQLTHVDFNVSQARTVICGFLWTATARSRTTNYNGVDACLATRDMRTWDVALASAASSAIAGRPMKCPG